MKSASSFDAIETPAEVAANPQSAPISDAIETRAEVAADATNRVRE